MSNLYSDIKNLQRLIEHHEQVKVINWGKENLYDFAPLSSGSPQTDEEARPTIRFILNLQSKIFTLQWLYLKKQGTGTGTKVFNWIKEFCEKYKFKIFEVKCVGKDKSAMLRLCVKMGMKINKKYDDSTNTFFDFRYEFKT